MGQEEFPYVHGFNQVEQDRLRRQAGFTEYSIYKDINFSSVNHLLEVGCGVGAQSEIILRRFPHLKLTGIDLNEAQVKACKKSLSQLAYAQGRADIQLMDASQMEFSANSFDGAFLCWVLEHLPSPLQVLSEVRRVLRPGSRIVVNEVMNHSFFLEPYGPNVWKYWMAFNDFQHDHAGDPFVGAKLGNMLAAVGFQNVETNVISWHLDNRNPEKRKEVIEYWSELLWSAEEQLISNEMVSQELVSQAKEEMRRAQRDPNAVFFYSFMQAKALAMGF